MVGQIFLNESERFQIDSKELSCGDVIDVLVFDGITQQTKWVKTSVEHNGFTYFLTGLLGYSPIGLFAKV